MCLALRASSISKFHLDVSRVTLIYHSETTITPFFTLSQNTFKSTINQQLTDFSSGDIHFQRVNSIRHPIITSCMFARYIELLFYRANAELKREASRAYLGMLWWLIEPVLYMSVFYVVFGLGLRQGGPDFVVYLLAGLITWKWLDSTVRTSSNIIATSVGLMNQVYLPKMVLPGVIVIANTYKFLIVFSLFLVFLVVFWGIPASEHWQALPLLLAMQFLLICAVAGIGAALVPVIPDLKYVVDYGMTLMFFMSGIFFDINDLTPEIQQWLRYNPMVIFIESYRDVLLYAQWPDWQALLNVLYASAALFLTMLVLLVKLDRFYPRVVG